MCLYTKQKICRRTLMPITVYKILYKYNEEYRSPIQNYRFESNKKYKTRFKNRSIKPDIYIKEYNIVNLGFHSFAKLSSAKNYKAAMEFSDHLCHQSSKAQYAVAECIIPIFSKYFKGNNLINGVNCQYCSNKIIIKQIIG